MQLDCLISTVLLLGPKLTAAVPYSGSPVDELEKRQPEAWPKGCGNVTPRNFKAFNVGGCQAQLTFTRGKDIGIMWYFDAIYSGGSRKKFEPIRNFNNIAVSDPFYTLGYGNNYITNRTLSEAFTSVHEFPYVCNNDGEAPTAWIFYTSTSNSDCRFKTDRIAAKSGTRPAQTNFSGRSIDSEGNIRVSWTAVAEAKSYNVFVQIPTTEYEGGGGYFTTDRGARIQRNKTSAVFPGVVWFRNEEEPRRIYVNVMNSQGVWSYTPGVKTVDVYI